MFDIHAILVPVDFSDASKHAVGYGLSLARQYNARLILVHIVSGALPVSFNIPTESFRLEKDEADSAKRELQDLIPPDRRGGILPETIVRVGDVKDELLAIVSETKADLVIMGSHGRNAVDRWILGSVTERMLRKIPAPVITVSRLGESSALDKGEPVRLGRILYATDLSEDTFSGLKASIDLAQRYNAQLTVLHVIPDFKYAYWGSGFGNVFGEDLERYRKESDEHLTKLVKQFAPKDFKFSTMLPQGEPYREILKAAEQTGAGMIVLDLEERGVIERALLGATAERVIRLAHVPVLSVPPGAAEGADAKMGEPGATSAA